MDTQQRTIGTSQKRTGLLLALLSLFLTSLCLGQNSASPTQRRSRRQTSVVKVVLPKPRTRSSLSLEELLAGQGPLQMPAPTPLDVTDIGQLAWAAQGVSAEHNRALGGNDPMAGMQLLFVTVDGIFRYVPQGHHLEQITDGDARAPLVLAALGQPGRAVGCGVVIARSTAVRTARENNQAKRLLNLRVGQTTQILKLQASALGLITLDAGDFQAQAFRIATRLPKEVDPLHVLLVGYGVDQVAGEALPAPESIPADTAGTGTKRGSAALLVAAIGFRDEELFDTTRVLNAQGIDTVVVATRVGVARGMLGGVAQATVSVSQLDVEAYDAIVLIGGSGANELARNSRVATLVKEALGKEKIVAAIDVTTGILARADAVRGLRVTGYPSEQKRLTEAGGIYTGLTVERDGSIITASGPAASLPFGQAIADAILSR